MSVDEKAVQTVEKMAVESADRWVAWKAAQMVLQLVAYLAVHWAVKMAGAKVAQRAAL